MLTNSDGNERQSFEIRQVHPMTDAAQAVVYLRVRDDDGTVTVHLAPCHPGVDDPVYLARRGEIAKAALRWEPGTPAPAIEYSEQEHAVWRTVCRELQRKHATLAHSAYRDAWDAVALPTEEINDMIEEVVTPEEEGLEAIAH